MRDAPNVAASYHSVGSMSIITWVNRYAPTVPQRTKKEKSVHAAEEKFHEAGSFLLAFASIVLIPQIMTDCSLLHPHRR